jgi:hypothetical protein
VEIDMKKSVLLMVVSLFLSACATQPTTNYDLSADEMQHAGAASLNQHTNIKTLYTNAEFVKKNKPKGK